MHPCAVLDVLASGSEGFFSLECVFPADSQVERSILSSIWSIITPFFFALVFGIIFTFANFAMKWRKRKIIEWEETIILWKVAIISVFYVSYTQLTQNVLRIFNCIHVDDRKPDGNLREIATSWYWSEDTQVHCYEGNHIILFGALGVPVFLFVAVGMPVWLAVTLVWRKDPQRNEEATLRTYGFLYQSYRDGRKFWEVIIMLRKASLATIIVFSASLGTNLQAAMGLFVLFVALAAHEVNRPFIDNNYGPSLNRMESTSLACSILAFFTAIVFNDPETSPAGKTVVSVFFILIMATELLYLLASLVSEIIRGIDQFLKDKGMEIDNTTTAGMKIHFLIVYLTEDAFKTVLDLFKMALNLFKSRRAESMSKRMENA